MTREEALDIIRFVFLHTDNHLNDDRQISADDIHEALVMACATLCKNSLPSEIDEAAEKYSENILANNEDLQDAIEDAFKAGAEWMAGQGVNADFGVCKLAGRAWLTPIDEKRFTQDVFDNFAAGDKVIVQIRKKQ